MERDKFGPEGELKFNPGAVLVISFPHLDNLLVIDGRASQSLKRALLVPQEEILTSAKEEILSDFQDLLKQTDEIPQVLVSLPEQIRGSIADRITSTLIEKLNLQPDVVSENIASLPIDFLHVKVPVAQLWRRNKQSFFESFAGQIDLIADIRKCFEELIEKEKGQTAKNLNNFHPLWQSPNLN